MRNTYNCSKGQLLLKPWLDEVDTQKIFSVVQKARRKEADSVDMLMKLDIPKYQQWRQSKRVGRALSKGL